MRTGRSSASTHAARAPDRQQRQRAAVVEQRRDAAECDGEERRVEQDHEGGAGQRTDRARRGRRRLGRNRHVAAALASSVASVEPKIESQLERDGVGFRHDDRAQGSKSAVRLGSVVESQLRPERPAIVGDAAPQAHAGAVDLPGRRPDVVVEALEPDSPPMKNDVVSPMIKASSAPAMSE